MATGRARAKIPASRKQRRRQAAGSAPTVLDVAARAGVSPKTVSRVINHEPNVREEKARRVQRAIFELNYRPNLSAGSLSGRAAKLVPLLYDNPNDSYLVAIQQGAMLACRRLGYSLLLHPAEFDSAGLIDGVLAMVRERRPAGLLLTPPVSDVLALLDVLDQMQLPYVRIGSADESRPGPVVNADDRQGAHDVTAHLLVLGHRRVGFIEGHPAHRASATRLEGFLSAHRGSEIAVDSTLIGHGMFSFELAAEAARVLLSSRERPTAIFAANDEMAAAALRVAYEIGLRVPQDLSIAGFDDVPLARRVWPSLTTVRQPFRSMADEAVTVLVEAVRAKRDGRPRVERRVLLKSELIVRQSTAPPPTTVRS